MEEASKLYGEVRNKFIFNILVCQYLAHISSHRLNAQSLILKDMTEIDWSYKEWAINGVFLFLFFFFFFFFSSNLPSYIKQQKF